MPDVTPFNAVVGLEDGESLLYRGATDETMTEGPGAGGDSSTATTGESGSLLYDGDMPSLIELLEQNRVAYAVLERDLEVAAAPRERAVWVLLLVAGVLWGVISGLSFALSDFVVHPATALLGILGLGVVATSAWIAVHSDD